MNSKVKLENSCQKLTTRSKRLRQFNREEMQLYWVWCDMRYRCNNPKHKQFKDYGGRGIAYCTRWGSFHNFVDDMGERPKGGSLERVNNDLGYSPENCIWADRETQNNNRRNIIWVDDNGEKVSLKECCRRRGLRYRSIYARVIDRGWPVEMALNTPLRTGKHFSKTPRNQRKEASKNAKSM